MSDKRQNFGEGDATFQAVGGETGIRRLVDAFYDIMETSPHLAVPPTSEALFLLLR